MKPIHILSSSILLAMVFVSAAHAQGFTSGNWQGRALYDQAGKFDRCGMTGSYKSGHTLMFDIDPNFTWRMWIGNPQWNLPLNANYDAAIAIDQAGLIAVRAIVKSKTLIEIPLAATAPVVNGMRRGNLMQFISGNNRIPFALSGTSTAIGKLIDCVKIATGRPRQPEETQTSISSAPPRANFRLLTAAESAVLVTNLLNSAGVVNYRLEPPKDDSLARFVLADGSYGFLLASEGRNTKTADEYVAGTVARLTQSCAGDFISGKKTIASTDGSVVRKIAASCKDAGKITDFETTVIRKSNGFLMELTVMADPENYGQPNPLKRVAIKHARLYPMPLYVCPKLPA